MNTPGDRSGAGRVSMLWYGMIAIGILTAHARAQTVQVDDFNDGVLDGWTLGDSTAGTVWGPGLIDVNGKGELRFASSQPIPIDIGGLWTATLDAGMDDPLLYADGTVRARVRIDEPFTEAGIAMRLTGSLASGFDGYAFQVASGPRGGEYIISRFEGTVDTEEESIAATTPLDEDFFLQASALGNQFSLKIWPVSAPEPSVPQVTFTDDRYDRGTLAVYAYRHTAYGNYFIDAHAGAIFDDLTFIPASTGVPTGAVPELSSVWLACLSLATLLVGCRRRQRNLCCSRAATLVMGAAMAIGLGQESRAQVVFDLGTFIVRSDDPGSISLPIPAGNYNAFTLTTDWSKVGVDPWSEEAIWAIADAPLQATDATIYVDPGPAPNHQRNANPVTLEWSGLLDLPLTGPFDAFLLNFQTYDEPVGSNRFSARWANTVLELSYVTPPAPPELTASLGVVAGEFSPVAITSSGDFDTEIGVYSSTGAVIAKNDDAPSNPTPTVLSEVRFDHGLPAGDYIAVVGGFNTSFEKGYAAAPGDVGGNYGLNVAGNLFEGTLAAGDVAYVGFSIGDFILAGDYNGNGQVEQGDLDLVLLHWGSDTIPSAWASNPPTGAVDQQELDAVLLNWGSGAAPLGATSVPELGGLLLALAAIAGFRGLGRSFIKQQHSIS